MSKSNTKKQYQLLADVADAEPFYLKSRKGRTVVAPLVAVQAMDQWAKQFGLFLLGDGEEEAVEDLYQKFTKKPGK